MNLTPNIIRTIVISLIIFVIVLYIAWNTFKGFLPKSEIKLTNTTKNYKYSLQQFDKNKTFREFNVLDETLEQEINEIFQYPYIQWTSNFYHPTISFFKNFDCIYYKKIPKKRIEPYTFIYFPDNKIKWSSKIYLHDKFNNIFYYPEKNSVLYSDKELTWVGDNNINIVLGKPL